MIFLVATALEQSQQLDQSLWEAIRDGQKAALGELYELYYRPLYRFGTKLISDTALVEDTIQDLFITLWNTQHKLSNVRNVKAYLFTILRREIHQKSKKDQLVSDIFSIPTLNFSVPDNGYEQEDHEKWLVMKLTTMLKSLPKRQLDVILLRYYENFQTAEIATIMGITEKSVRNTLYKALTYMRTNIEPSDYLLLVALLFQFV